MSALHPEAAVGVISAFRSACDPKAAVRLDGKFGALLTAGLPFARFSCDGMGEVSVEDVAEYLVALESIGVAKRRLIK